MAVKNLNARVKIRRDKAADYKSKNPTLLAGELAIEQDTNKVKVGDGNTKWNNLDYLLDMDYVKKLLEDMKNTILKNKEPVGTIIHFSGSSIPSAYSSNWKVCNGSTVYKSTYPELFSNLGWTGSSHALPNLIDSRFIEGGTSVLTYKKEGLPNIKGGWPVDDNLLGMKESDDVKYTNTYGCFNKNGYRYHFVWSTGGGRGGTLQFDASRSGTQDPSNNYKVTEWTTIYSDDVKTVQPRSLVLLPIIRVK